MKGIADSGLRPCLPEGGFFIMADISMVDIPEKYLNEPSLAKT